MSKDASDKKKRIRATIRQTLSALSHQEKKIASEKIRTQISELSLSRCAIFAGTSIEPNLLPLLKHHPQARWFLPRVSSETEMEFVEITADTKLQPGAYGILEPIGIPASPEEITTIFCPGLAFTIAGNRLGQGGGFYDRFLKQTPDTQVIGICFDCQVLEELPNEPHDIKMSLLISG